MWEIKKQSVHYRILRSHKDTLHGRSDGIFPRTKKQSTGLFFARCGAPSCSNPRPSGDKKDPQPKLEVLLVGVTGFEPTASWSRTKRATNCATPRKEKPQQPGCCGVVGDERIELPRAESESAALPLCESPSRSFQAPCPQRSFIIAIRNGFVNTFFLFFSSFFLAASFPYFRPTGLTSFCLWRTLIVSTRGVLRAANGR